MTRPPPSPPNRGRSGRRRRWSRERRPGDLPSRAAGLLLFAARLHRAVLLPVGERGRVHLPDWGAERSPLGGGAAARLLLPCLLADAAPARAAADHAPGERGA